MLNPAVCLRFSLIIEGHLVNCHLTNKRPREQTFKMAQWVMGLATQPDALGSISRTSMLEAEN